MPTAFAIARTVQWVASSGGRLERQRHHLVDPAGGERRLPGGRVLSRSRPSTPSAMKRSCQRHTQVFDLPVAAMIAIGAQTLVGQQHDPRSPDMLLRRTPRRDDRSSRAWSAAVTSILIPVRIPRHGMRRGSTGNPSSGLFRPDQSTLMFACSRDRREKFLPACSPAEIWAIGSVDGQSRRQDFETTGGHALIRGLVTAGPDASRSCLSLEDQRRIEIRLLVEARVLLP